MRLSVACFLVLVNCLLVPAASQEPPRPQASPSPQAQPDARPQPQADPEFQVIPLPQVPTSSQKRPIKLMEAVDLGVAQSPNLKQSAQGIQSAIGDFEQSDSQKNLKFVFQDESIVLSKQSIATTRQNTVSSQLSLTMQALLTTFGRVENEIAAAFLQIDVATQQLELDRQDLVLSIKESFFRRLQADETLDVAKQNLELTKQNLSDTNALFNQGLAAKYDIVQAELQVVEAQQTLAQSITSIGNTAIALKTVLYDQSQEDLAPIPPASAVVEPGVELEGLVALALQSRPEVILLDKNIAVADKLLEAAHHESLPIVSLQAGYFDTVGSFLPTDTFGVNLSVSWSLWDGGFRDGRVKSAEAQVQALHDQLDGLNAQVIQEATQAWLNFKQSEFDLRTAEKQVETAAVFYEMARERFINGLGTSLETQNALQSLINARLDLAVSRYNREISFSRLERALGTQFPDRVLKLSSLPSKGAPDAGS